MFTLDWYGHEDAEEAAMAGHKCVHVIDLDNGNFAAQLTTASSGSTPLYQPFMKAGICHQNCVWKVNANQRKYPGYFYDPVGAAPRFRAGRPSIVKGLRRRRRARD